MWRPSSDTDAGEKRVLIENKTTQNRPKQHRARRNPKEGKKMLEPHPATAPLEFDARQSFNHPFQVIFKRILPKLRGIAGHIEQAERSAIRKSPQAHKHFCPLLFTAMVFVSGGFVLVHVQVQVQVQVQNHCYGVEVGKSACVLVGICELRFSLPARYGLIQTRMV